MIGISHRWWDKFLLANANAQIDEAEKIEAGGPDDPTAKEQAYRLRSSHGSGSGTLGGNGDH